MFVTFLVLFALLNCLTHKVISFLMEMLDRYNSKFKHKHPNVTQSDFFVRECLLKAEKIESPKLFNRTIESKPLCFLSFGLVYWCPLCYRSSKPEYS